MRVYRSGHELIADIAKWSDEQLAAMPSAQRASGVPEAGPLLAEPIAAALAARFDGADAAQLAAAQALAEDAAIGVAYRKPPWQAPLLDVLGRM